MSFMLIECPWCAETYTFGIVGTTQIGTGHTCAAEIPCEHEGCDRLARFTVTDGLVPMVLPEEQKFVCSDHINGYTITGCQPYSPARGQEQP